MAEFIVHPDDKFRLGDFLLQSFANPDWTEFRAAVAFVKRSGTKHIRKALARFSNSASVTMSVGIDSGGTSSEGLEDLIGAISPGGKLRVFHNAGSSTFHPKIYLFKNASAADVIVGSGNLTEGGLYKNYEASIRLILDLSDPSHRTMLASLEVALDRWSSLLPGRCYDLDTSLLKKLIESGRVPVEALAKDTEEGDSTSTKSGMLKADSLFKAFGVQGAPKVTGHASGAGSVKSVKPVKVSASASTVLSQKFLMTLQTTDVGFGQTKIGTAQRSPEIFIPIRAVDANPSFWEWPGSYVDDIPWSKRHAKKIAEWAKTRSAKRPLIKMDRNNVLFKIVGIGKPVFATIWYNPERVDLRIRNKTLRSAGKVGDIMVLEKIGTGAKQSYRFEVIVPSDSRYLALKKACNVKVGGNSPKTYAYI